MLVKDFLILPLENLQNKLEDDENDLCPKNTIFQYKWILLAKCFYLIKDFE
jgi:hypothetical protein